MLQALDPTLAPLDPLCPPLDRVLQALILYVPLPTVTAVDPDYHWTSVQFNKNFRGSLHRDEKDASYQVISADLG